MSTLRLSQKSYTARFMYNDLKLVDVQKINARNRALEVPLDLKCGKVSDRVDFTNLTSSLPETIKCLSVEETLVTRSIYGRANYYTKLA